MFRRLILYIFCVSVLFSCGNKELKSRDAIFMANVYLSNNNCELALKELTGVDPTYHDFYYYQALSSAKACNADYSVLDFIDEIDSFTDSSSFFNFLAGLNSSNETLATSPNFGFLADAINSILYLNSSNEARFSHRLSVIKNRSQAEELSLQALLMIFVYTGKWLKLYGATDDAGLKGSNVLCLLDYPLEASSYLSLAERTALLGNSGTCLPGSGNASPLLPLGNESTRNALCNFIVYFNHIRDITSNITLSSHDSLGDLSDAFTDMENFIQAAEVAFPGISNIVSFYNLSSCTSYYDSNNTAKKNIHAFMAGVVDENFQ